MAAVATRIFCALILLAPSCGTQGDASVLPDYWPRAGLSGYVFWDPDAPVLLSEPGWDLDEPAAADVAGTLQVYGRMGMSRGPAASQLFAAQVTAFDVPAAPSAALEASLPWEGASLRGPSIAAAELPLLFYQGEDGSLGVAERDGGSLNKSASAPLAAAALLGGGRKIGRAACVLDPGPSPSPDDDRFRLYYTVDDNEVYVAVAPAEPVLAVGLSHAERTVDWQVRPLGLVASLFSVPPGDEKAVPAERIAELSARRVLTPAGRVRWDLFLVATAGTRRAVVAASAYAEGQSGLDERFSAAQVPLIATSDGTLLSPTVMTWRGKPLLLVGLRQVQTTIAAAVLP